ncbi:MAG: hypothetical protein ABI206_13800 [Antricoccus sp.]
MRSRQLDNASRVRSPDARSNSSRGYGLHPLNRLGFGEQKAGPGIGEPAGV